MKKFSFKKFLLLSAIFLLSWSIKSFAHTFDEGVLTIQETPSGDSYELSDFPDITDASSVNKIIFDNYNCYLDVLSLFPECVSIEFTTRAYNIKGAGGTYNNITEFIIPPTNKVFAFTNRASGVYTFPGVTQLYNMQFNDYSYYIQNKLSFPNLTDIYIIRNTCYLNVGLRDIPSTCILHANTDVQQVFIDFDCTLDVSVPRAGIVTFVTNNADFRSKYAYDLHDMSYRCVNTKDCKDTVVSTVWGGSSGYYYIDQSSSINSYCWNGTSFDVSTSHYVNKERSIVYTLNRNGYSCTPTLYLFECTIDGSLLLRPGAIGYDQSVDNNCDVEVIGLKKGMNIKVEFKGPDGEKDITDQVDIADGYIVIPRVIFKKINPDGAKIKTYVTIYKDDVKVGSKQINVSRSGGTVKESLRFIYHPTENEEDIHIKYGEIGEDFTIEQSGDLEIPYTCENGVFSIKKEDIPEVYGINVYTINNVDTYHEYTIKVGRCPWVCPENIDEGSTYATVRDYISAINIPYYTNVACIYDPCRQNFDISDWESPSLGFMHTVSGDAIVATSRTDSFTLYHTDGSGEVISVNTTTSQYTSQNKLVFDGSKISHTSQSQDDCRLKVKSFFSKYAPSTATVDWIIIGNRSVPFTFDGDSAVIIIPRDVLLEYDNGLYNVHLSSNGKYSSTILELTGHPGSAPFLEQVTRWFDYSDPEDSVFDMSLGKGAGHVDGVKGVYVDDVKLTENQYIINPDYTKLTLKSSFLLTQKNGKHSVSLLFSNKDYVSGAFVTVIGAMDMDPSMDKQSKQFDATNPADVTFTYSLGAGSKAASSIKSVEMNNKEITVTTTDADFTISKDVLLQYGNGTYPIKVIFDNGFEISNSSVEIVNSLVVTPVDPSIEQGKKTFDYNNKLDITFTFDLGVGSSIATSVSKVLIDDTELTFTAENNTLTLPQFNFEILENGEYPLIVEFDNGFKAEGITVKVINKPVPIRRNPSIEHQQKVFDMDAPADISFTYDLGSEDLEATGIHRIFLGDVQVAHTVSEDFFTLSQNLFEDLSNGVYQVTVEFDNYYEAKGSSVRVINAGSSTPSTNKPPVVLQTLVYEYYKDYPRDVIIPVQFNDATNLRKLRIGSVDLTEDDWSVEDDAIVINSSYLDTLDADSYRVIPTFNDPAQTVASNLKLRVYDSAEDRESPYLLYDRIKFDASDLDLLWSEGYGSAEASDVLALQLDSKLVLPTGKIIPFSQSAIKQLKKEYEKDKYPIATDSNATKPDNVPVATSSNATEPMSSPYLLVKSAIRALSEDTGTAYAVEGNHIYVDGSYVESLKLSKGDHLIGAVFNNTDTTTDLCKVILTILEDPVDDNPGGDDKPTNPDNPGEDDKPTNPDKPGTGDDKPTNPDKPGTGDDKPSKPDDNNSGNEGGSGNDKPSRPSYSEGSSGDSGGGHSGSSSVQTIKGKHSDGSWDSKYRPTNIGQNLGQLSLAPDGSTIVLDADGNVAYNKWVLTTAGWYHTDETAHLRLGWYLDGDKWYMLDRLTGIMKLGWYYEQQDNKWYFLSPVDGHMLTGWQAIDYKWYYFTVIATGQTYFGDNINGWTYKADVTSKPYGSMWCNEITPDNYLVDTTGAWVK